MARQVVIDILGDSKNFTRAAQEATAVGGNMTAGLGKASKAANTLEKDLAGMGKGMAANIPVAGGFGGAMGGLSLPLLGAAAAVGGLVVAGKSMIDISEKWEAAQKGLKQATDNSSISYELARYRVDEFIFSNKKFVSSQAEVVDSYAALAREGLNFKQVQDDLNLALDLQAIKRLPSLTDATLLLQQAEMGRGRALLPLGIQMKEYPVLTETATVAARKLADAEKAVEKAQLAHTAAVKAHGPHSAQAKASAVALADANKKLAEAHAYAAERAAASAEIHDLLHKKLDGGRKTTSDLKQATNELGNTWQTFSQQHGPAFLKIFTTAIQILGKVADAVGVVLAKSLDFQNAVGSVFTKTPNTAASTFGPAAPHGLTGKAAGGPVLPHSSYTVGEQGPETLVMGNQAGMVIPNRGGAGDLRQLERLMALAVDHLDAIRRKPGLAF